MKLTSYIAFCLLITFSSCDYISNVQYKNAIIEGNKAVDSSKLFEAIRFFNQAKEFNTNSEIAYYNSGNSLLHLQHIDSSRNEYLRAIERTKDSSTLSAIYYQIGNVSLTNHALKKEEVNDNLNYIDSVKSIENKTIQERIRFNIAKDSILNTNDSILKYQDKILNEAKQHYKKSIGHNFLNDSAQYNYIYTLYLLKKDKESKENDKKDDPKKSPTKYALKQKEKALELIKQNKFKEAYQLLDNASLKDETVKSFDELIKKLKDVNDIIEKNEN